jgi:UrcA family protein
MKTTIHNSFRPVLVAATLVAGFALTAHAEEFPQVHVNYADLNVNSTAGAKVLYQRIRAAADKVCDVYGDRDLGTMAAAKACKTHAIAEAVGTVHSPMLTRVYESTTGIKATTQLAALR